MSILAGIIEELDAEASFEEEKVKAPTTTKARKARATKGTRSAKSLIATATTLAAAGTSTTAPEVDEEKGSALRSAIESLEGVSTETIEEEAAATAEIVGLEPIKRPNGQEYHPRVLAGRADVKALEDLRAAGVAILLSGYPGCGKTALIEAAFEDVITFAGHGEAEIGDLVGTYVQRPDGSISWEDGPLVRAMKNGSVLFVDDATLTPSGVLARLYPAMDGRGTIVLTEHEGEVIHAAEGFYVVGAHNPGVPGAVLSEALSSRFSLQLEVPSDLRLARRLKVDSKVISITRTMQLKREAGEVLWAPEMRELLAFKRIKEVLGLTAAMENLVSICPESDREVFIKLVNKQAPGARPLALEDSPI